MELSGAVFRFLFFVEKMVQTLLQKQMWTSVILEIVYPQLHDSTSSMHGITGFFFRRFVSLAICYLSFHLLEMMIKKIQCKWLVFLSFKKFH